MRLTVDNTTLSSRGSYPFQYLSGLTISWPRHHEAFHTLIMYDLDAPYPESPSNSPFVHLLKINVPGTDASGGTTVFPYLPPSPPSNSNFHRYRIDLYSQTRQISVPSYNNRANFPLDTLVSQNGLKILASETIIVDPSQNIFYIERPRIKKSLTPHIYVKAGSTLTEKEQSYCSCVAQVATKQPGACNLEKAWFEERDDQVCYNPFAVCAKSVGTTTRACLSNYDYDVMDDDMITSVAYLHNITVATPYNRQTIITRLQSK